MNMGQYVDEFAERLKLKSVILTLESLQSQSQHAKTASIAGNNRVKSSLATASCFFSVYWLKALSDSVVILLHFPHLHGQC